MRERNQRRWEQGAVCFGRGDWAGAIAAWGHCEWPGVQRALAEAHFRQGLSARNKQQAVASLEAAVKLLPEDARLVYHVGLGYFRAGRIQDALRRVQESVRMAPWEPRYHQSLSLIAALAGQDGQERDWRSVWLLAAAAGRWPDRGDEAPWAAALLKASMAAVDSDWAGVVAAADRGLTFQGVPDHAAQALSYYRALGAAASRRWEEVPVPAAEEGPFASRLARLRRTAEAALLRADLEGGAAAAAEERWKALMAYGGLPGEVRDRVLLRIGMMHAQEGAYQEAIRLWQQVDKRFVLAQPLALAYERAGQSEEARARWEQVTTQARRGVAPAGLDPQTVVVAVSHHLAESAEDSGDLTAAARRADEALVASGGNLPAQRYVEVAELYERAFESPYAKEGRVIDLLTLAVQADPQNREAWSLLAWVCRRCGRIEEAARASEALALLDVSDRNAALWAVEDLGRIVMAQLQDGDLELIESLLPALRARSAGYEPRSARELYAALADLVEAVLARVGGAKRKSPTLKRWDHLFVGHQPGSDTPLALFALRGLLYLWRGELRAEWIFQKIANAPYWSQSVPAEKLGYSRYMSWIGYAHCWVRQLKAKGSLEDCEGHPQCRAMWDWLHKAGIGNPNFTFQQPPECLRGCPNLPRLHRQWVANFKVHRREADRWVRRLADLLGDMDEEEREQWIEENLR